MERELIVVVRPITEAALEAKLVQNRIKVAVSACEAPTKRNNDWLLRISRDQENKVRDWFANDDDVLWFR